MKNSMIIKLIKKDCIKKLFSIGVLMCFLMVGVVFASADSIAVKADEDIVYQNITADSVTDLFAKNGANIYGGKYFAVTGRIKSLSQDYLSFDLYPVDDTGDVHISCTLKNRLHSMVSASLFEDGSDEERLFKVLGRFDDSSKDLTMKVDYVFEVSDVSSETEWSIKSDSDGKIIDRIYDTRKTYNRSIADKNGNSRMKYEIPTEWKQIEQKLPNVDGYQYALNRLDNLANEEVLYVFYVDNSHLKEPEDKKDTEGFFNAIVRNISGDGGIADENNFVEMKLSHKYVRTKVSADYAELTYYKGTFKDINGKDHRLEYIFLPRPDVNIGPQVFLYLYPVDGPSETHRDDILYVLRSLYF